MQTPAPKSCHPEKTQSEDWTKSFLATSTSRTQRLLVPLLWIIVVCAVFPVGLPTGFNSLSYADGATTSVAFTDAAKAVAALPAGANTEGSPASAAVSNTVPTTTSETASPVTTVPVATVPAAVSAGAAEVPQTPQAADSSPLSVQQPTATEPNVSEALVSRAFRINAVIGTAKQSGTVVLPLNEATVGSALTEMGVKLNALDRVAPLATQPLKDGMTIKVTRVTATIRKVYAGVGTETRYKPTPAIKSGTQQTIQKGQSGVIERTERIWQLNGKYVKTEVMATRTVKPALNTIIALGTKPAYMPGRIPYHNRYAQAYQLSARGGSPRDRMAANSAPMPAPDPKTLRAVRSIDLVATGYSPDPRENGGYTTTATGLPIGYGAAAVDPRVVPLGTKMYIEGYGYAFACDTGGAIKGHRIDLAYDSYYLANTKGRRKVKAWILSE